MRIWDVDPAVLCRQHLLGEHRELHAVWTILTTDSPGYRRHPETLRWEGRLAVLARRHDQLVDEMERRGYRHHSRLDLSLATGGIVQTELVDPPETQMELLRAKPCLCPISIE
jgi:hypothetical protein